MMLFLFALFQQAAASPSPSPPGPGLTTTLDIAAVISAVLWPLVILAILLLYRKKIPAFVEGGRLPIPNFWPQVLFTS